MTTLIGQYLMTKSRFKKGLPMPFDRTRLPDPVSYFESRGQKIVGKRGKHFRTTCAIHGGDDDNLSVLRDTGAFHCFSGNCGAHGGDVISYAMQADGTDFVTTCKALGAWVEDGKPPGNYKPKPLPAADALRILAHETMLVAIIASDMCRGIPIDEETKDRLLQAVGRINSIQGAYQ